MLNLSAMKEFSLLLQAVSLVVDGTIEGNERRAHWLREFKNCDFELLVRLAKSHGVIPWLVECLNQSGGSDSPELFDEFRTLDEFNRITRFHSDYQAAVAVKICAEFEAHAIPHVVFKGVAVIEQFYAGFIQSRESDDLDILIGEHDLSRAVALLMKLDYHAREVEQVLKVSQFIEKNVEYCRWRDIAFARHSQPRHKIDLHWKIADSFTYPVNTQDLINAKTRIKVADGVLATLPFDEQFVYVCVHGCADYFFRLRYLVDVYAGMQQVMFDKEQVLQLATYRGVEWQVQSALDLAEVLFQGREIRSMSKLSNLVLDRYKVSRGIPRRIHPSRKQWKRSDKNKHLIRQISNRSKKARWFAPVFARFKLNFVEISEDVPTPWFKRIYLRLVQ